MLCVVRPDEATALWPVIWPLLKPAAKRAQGGWSEAATKAAIEDGTAQLWASWDGKLEAVALTQIIHSGPNKLCAIPLLGGKSRDNWLRYESDIAEWAKGQGCVALEGYARPGWLRVLHSGWRHCWTVIRKDI